MPTITRRPRTELAAAGWIIGEDRVGLDRPRRERRPHRERGEDDRAIRPCAVRSHQTAEVGAFAQCLDDGVEDLGGVATGRPLQLGQERDLFEVAARHPGRNAADRLFIGMPSCSSVMTR